MQSTVRIHRARKFAGLLGAALVVAVSVWAYLRLDQSAAEGSSPIQPETAKALEMPVEEKALFDAGAEQRADPLALSEPAPPVPRAISIRCVGPEGEPLEGADVLCFLDGTWIVQGRTDALGQYLWSHPGPFGGEAGLRFSATRAGYATVEGKVKPDESSVELVMELGGVIEGVLRGNYSRMPEVILVPDTDEWLDFRVSELGAGNPRYMRVQPKPSGTFRVEGLRIDQPYLFVALGQGGMSENGVTAIAGPQERPGQVEVYWAEIFVAKVIFTGPGGEALHMVDNSISAGSKRSSGPKYQIPDGLTFRGTGSALAWKLMSLQPSFTPAEKIWRPTLLASRFGPTAPVLTDIPFTFQLPGYELLNGSIDFAPLLESLEPVRYELTPWAEGWGTVEVELVGLEYLEDRAPSSHGPRSYFVYLEGEGAIWTRGFRPPLTSPLVLHDVPTGQYQVRLGTPLGSLRLDSMGGPIQVGEQTAHVAFDLSLTGSLELRLFDRGQPIFPRKINYSLIIGSGEREGKWETFYCPGPPYVTHHLPEGLYHVWLDLPWSVGHVNPAATPRNSILIHGGDTTVVDLHKPVGGQ